MYLWVAVPDGETSEGFADRLLERGVARRAGLVSRPLGRGLRPLALVPTEEECARAVEILEEVL